MTDPPNILSGIYLIEVLLLKDPLTTLEQDVQENRRREKIVKSGQEQELLEYLNRPVSLPNCYSQD